MMKRHTLLTLASCALVAPIAAQWTPLTGGGVVQSIRSMTHAGTDLYAATYPSGVKKSTNGGTLWDPANTGLPTSGANVFCESVGYNGTYLFAGTQSGIYRSNDGAANWEAANGTLTASSTVFANKWFVNDGITMAIFSGSIANGGGIWRTGNNGTSWSIGHSGMGSNVVVHHVTPVGTTLWASTSVGLYTSPDNGLNWTVHPSVNYATYSLAQVGSDLVILSNFGYRYSTNGGTSWNDATGDPASPTEGELVAYDGILYANTGGAGGCLMSVDNGQSWAAFNTGLGAIDQASLEEFHVAGTKLYVTALFEIYYITGLGTAAQDLASTERVVVFPTLFEDSFTISMSTTMLLEMELSDARGALVRRFLTQGPTTVVMREQLNAGTYRLRGIDRSGRLHDLGAVIAR